MRCAVRSLARASSAPPSTVFPTTRNQNDKIEVYPSASHEAIRLGSGSYAEFPISYPLMELIRSLIMSEKPYNKVFAAQLLVSQQARTLQADDAEQWQLFASTTL